MHTFSILNPIHFLFRFDKHYIQGPNWICWLLRIECSEEDACCKSLQGKATSSCKGDQTESEENRAACLCLCTIHTEAIQTTKHRTNKPNPACMKLIWTLLFLLILFYSVHNLNLQTLGSAIITRLPGTLVLVVLVP